MANTSKSFLTRALWPVLGAGLLAVVVLQARAAGIPARRTAAPAPAAASTASDHHVAAEGRLVAYPGAEVVVGTDLAGTVVILKVQEKEPVRRGQLLAELRSDDYRASLAEARARVTEADAEIRLAESELERARSLREQAVGSQEALDKAERDIETARARRTTAAATVNRLDAVLAKTRIVSPIDGVVTARWAQPGETLEAGQKIVTVADLSRTRVEAELDEFDSGRVRLGDEVKVTAEGYDRVSWRGRVEEIPDSVVGRRLKPQDPGKPEDTRVLLVKIALLEPTPLKLGQRVEVRIN
ncbi:MAG TPA: efflux RND transporter periplasmic adaptor subunit [Thermoanaerobaculia bacterium]|nr:efflux RND transporter periplasmic adaptor subunit [Thermoanaerobaculia bacterium]